MRGLCGSNPYGFECSVLIIDKICVCVCVCVFKSQSELNPRASRNKRPVLFTSNKITVKLRFKFNHKPSRKISCPSLARFSRSHGPLRSRPFEGKKGGGWGRESERCAIAVGKMRESTCDPLRLRHWRNLPQVFIPAAPIRAGQFIITNIWSMNARSRWREEILHFNSFVVESSSTLRGLTLGQPMST